MTTLDIDIEGGRVRIDGPDHAPSLVFAHALGTDHHLWDLQAEHFSRHWRVVRFDAFGHGASSEFSGGYLKQDDLALQVVQVLDALAIKRTAFVGTSMGAVVGLAAAQRHAHRLSHLVLCGAHLHRNASKSTDLQRRAQSAQGGTLNAIARDMMPRWFPARGVPVPPAILRSIEDGFLSTSPAG